MWSSRAVIINFPGGVTRPKEFNAQPSTWVYFNKYNDMNVHM